MGSVRMLRVSSSSMILSISWKLFTLMLKFFEGAAGYVSFAPWLFFISSSMFAPIEVLKHSCFGAARTPATCGE